MSIARRIEWLPALLAVASLIVIQFVHFAVSDPVHGDESAGHSHEAPATHDGAPADGHIDTAHCASHGSCHLLLHAMASTSRSRLGLQIGAEQNLTLTPDRTSGRSVKPPTPPPLA